ncbi:uncharacterized protein LOC112502737 [Cynara cardunculus var. scolymus]|uniref:uncharacterized protein LOC112502737 n=1 Tax=Cynara cardunculus var. scolymus TaxID=59895 RepID=UPI000D62A1CC|nr:uncharacterized protein LOC112502737 [Cynara cardunculus var. scolymus]
MTKLEEMMTLQIHIVNHLFGYCTKAIAKERETESGVAPLNGVATAEQSTVPATDVEAEAEVDIADENPTFCEALVVEDVDVVRAGAEARDDDLPITSATNVGDMEDDDEDEEDGEYSNLHDAVEDVYDDDEDDNDDDFTIQ